MDTPNNPSIKTSPPPNALFQALEKRFMFDAAAASTTAKAVDLSDGVSAQEQQEVLAALAANPHAIATQSLLHAIQEPNSITENYNAIHEVVFIDSRVQDPQEIIANLTRDAAVEIIGPGQDGALEIANILKNYHNLDAIHIISHGNQGELYLGNSGINMQDLSAYSSEIADWGKAISAQGSILLYGCDVAEGNPGVEFVQALSKLTSANIEASTDITGGSAVGGDWDLEYQSSSNSHRDGIINDPNYAHALDDIAPTLSVFGLNPNYTERSPTAMLLFSGANASTVDNGQVFTGMTITVTNLTSQGDITGDIISFDGTNISLADPSISYTTANHSLSVTGSVSGNTATFSFTGGSLDHTELESLINNMTFRSTSHNPAASQKVAITQITDSGSNISPNSNTTNSSTHFSTVSITPIDEAATLSATATNPIFTQISGEVHLFQNAVLSDYETEQTITHLTIQISNAASTDILHIDATPIPLVSHDPFSFDNVNDHVEATVSVSNVNGSNLAIIDLNFTSPHKTRDQVATLINTMTFSNTVFSPGTRAISITSLTDSGNTGGQNTNTTSLNNINSSVTIAHADVSNNSNNNSSTSDSSSSNNSNTYSSNISNLNSNSTTSSSTADQTPPVITLPAATNTTTTHSTTTSTNIEADLSSTAGAEEVLAAYKNAVNQTQKTTILANITTSMSKGTTTQASAVAESIYEIAVKTTKQTNTTTFLEDVVSTITQGFKDSKSLTIFLEKVAHDQRLTLEERAILINALIKEGKQEAAQILLQKLDKAPDALDYQNDLSSKEKSGEMDASMQKKTQDLANQKNARCAP